MEINDFAVTVAKTALWIAESQMMKKTEEIMEINLDFLPLKSYPHVVEGNALRINWNEIIVKNKLNYIMGNPPFSGARLMNKEQKLDLEIVFGKMKGLGNLDYVSGWYKKASQYIQGTNIKVAFVSTNSIIQGEQPPILWRAIFDTGININFAYKTFKWNSEAKDKATVHCIIIGFSFNNTREKYLYISDSNMIKVNNINAYLLPAPNIFIESRKTPIGQTSKIDFGSMPNDGGFLSNYSNEDKEQIEKKYPLSKKMFRKFLGATEFINNKTRWCLWLKNISPSEIKQVPPVLNAIKEVQKNRSQSKRKETKKLSEIPYLFGEIRQPSTDYLMIPCHSSENRKYIPIGFINQEIIASNAVLVIPDGTLYSFGILTSSVHMNWTRVVCGRLESRYRYSANIVYNNFPWCEPTDEQKEKIEQTAQGILDARNIYPDSSLADLYNESTMPVELRKAHQQNDKAVMEAYGFPIKSDFTESMCVAKLMEMYKDKIKKLEK